MNQSNKNHPSMRVWKPYKNQITNKKVYIIWLWIRGCLYEKEQIFTESLNPRVMIWLNLFPSNRCFLTFSAFYNRHEFVAQKCLQRKLHNWQRGKVFHVSGIPMVYTQESVSVSQKLSDWNLSNYRKLKTSWKTSTLKMCAVNWKKTKEFHQWELFFVFTGSLLRIIHPLFGVFFIFYNTSRCVNQEPLFSHRNSLHLRDGCFACLFFSDKLFSYHGNLFHSSDFLRYNVGPTQGPLFHSVVFVGKLLFSSRFNLIEFFSQKPKQKTAFDDWWRRTPSVVVCVEVSHVYRFWGTIAFTSTFESMHWSKDIIWLFNSVFLLMLTWTNLLYFSFPYRVLGELILFWYWWRNYCIKTRLILKTGSNKW